MRNIVFLIVALLFSTTIAQAAQENMLTSKIQTQTDAEFKKMDRNSNGQISLDEYQGALQTANVNDDIVAKSMAAFEQIDLDGNGQISFEEYNKFMNFALETISNMLQSQQQSK